MTTTSDYIEYLISSVNDETALEYATEHGLQENSWFRLPSTLNDATELFKKEATRVLSKEEWAALTKEDYQSRTLTGVYDDRILFAKDFHSAARYAAKRNWWLHSWKFIADTELEEVIEYGFYC